MRGHERHHRLSDERRVGTGAEIQTKHEELARRLPDFGLSGAAPVVTAITGATTDQVVAIANGIVNQQAAMIAHLDDFMLMTVMTPLVLFLRRPAGTTLSGSAADAMWH